MKMQKAATAITRHSPARSSSRDHVRTNVADAPGRVKSCSGGQPISVWGVANPNFPLPIRHSNTRAGEFTTTVTKNSTRPTRSTPTCATRGWRLATRWQSRWERRETERFRSRWVSLPISMATGWSQGTAEGENRATMPGRANGRRRGIICQRVDPSAAPLAAATRGTAWQSSW